MSLHNLYLQWVSHGAGRCSLPAAASFFQLRQDTSFRISVGMTAVVNRLVSLSVYTDETIGSGC
jgi:hypothetical protein